MCVCAYMQAYAWDVLGVHACMYSVPWPNDVHMCVSTVCKCRCVWMHVHVPECLWRTWVYILPKELTHIGTRRLIHTYSACTHAYTHTTILCHGWDPHMSLVVSLCCTERHRCQIMSIRSCAL